MQHIDRRLSLSEQPFVLGGDVGVAVRAICASLQDSSVLVQRHALDLLLVSLPMHDGSAALEDDSDLTDLVTAACAVLLRRDMSLNRRFFSWMLGCDASSTGPSQNDNRSGAT